MSKYQNFLFSFSLGFLISHSILMQMAFLFNMLKKPSLYLHKGLRLLNRKSTQFFLPVSFFLSSISFFLPYCFCLPISFFLSICFFLAKHGDNQRIRIWIENNRICSAFFLSLKVFLCSFRRSKLFTTRCCNQTIQMYHNHLGLLAFWKNVQNHFTLRNP